MSGLTWAPIFACYGDNNRTNMLRIPKGGGRVECRAADSANNPYLGAALMLAAGLEGIREGLDPGEPNRDNLYQLSDTDLVDRGIGWLPRSLGRRHRRIGERPAGAVGVRRRDVRFVRLREAARMGVLHRARLGVGDRPLPEVLRDDRSGPSCPRSNSRSAFAADPDTVALIPVGATEQHGPHLPVGTDTIIAPAVAEAAAR